LGEKKGEIGSPPSFFGGKNEGKLVKFGEFWRENALLGGFLRSNFSPAMFFGGEMVENWGPPDFLGGKQ